MRSDVHALLNDKAVPRLSTWRPIWKPKPTPWRGKVAPPFGLMLAAPAPSFANSLSKYPAGFGGA